MALVVNAWLYQRTYTRAGVLLLSLVDMEHQDINICDYEAGLGVIKRT